MSYGTSTAPPAQAHDGLQSTSGDGNGRSNDPVAGTQSTQTLTAKLRAFYDRNFGLFLVLMAQVFGSLVSLPPLPPVSALQIQARNLTLVDDHDDAAIRNGIYDKIPCTPDYLCTHADNSRLWAVVHVVQECAVCPFWRSTGTKVTGFAGECWICWVVWGIL